MDSSLPGYLARAIPLSLGVAEQLLTCGLFRTRAYVIVAHRTARRTNSLAWLPPGTIVKKPTQLDKAVDTLVNNSSRTARESLQTRRFRRMSRWRVRSHTAAERLRPAAQGRYDRRSSRSSVTTRRERTSGLYRLAIGLALVASVRWEARVVVAARAAFFWFRNCPVSPAAPRRREIVGAMEEAAAVLAAERDRRGPYGMAFRRTA